VNKVMIPRKDFSWSLVHGVSIDAADQISPKFSQVGHLINKVCVRG
jgi:hypothetical protein